MPPAGLPNEGLRKKQKQNMFAKLVLQEECTSYYESLVNLGLQNLEDRRKSLTLAFAKRSLADGYFSDLFKKRKPSQIKFIIFHYTGMKSEKEAVDRLTDIKSQVSSHYLIKNNGKIITLVPDLYIAWHAGISSWKNYKSLNKNSIGIEITNPGHDHKYKKFSKNQILSIIKLSKFLIKNGLNGFSRNLIFH